MVKVILKPKHALPLWKGHPWVFKESIKKIEGEAKPGDLVSVFDDRERWIGTGWFSPASQIQVRLLSWDSKEDLTDGSFLKQRILKAIHLRKSLLNLQEQTNSYRLVHSEGDRLPGLIADWFDGSLILGISTAGMYQHQQEVQEIFQKELAPKAIFILQDLYLKKEGIEPSENVFDSNEIKIQEHHCLYSTKLGFQKTGFYLDQRENRLKFREWAYGDVLDAFCFSGGFGVNGLKGKANSVTFLDSSPIAVENTKTNLEMNALQGEVLRGDVHHTLREWKKQNRLFDTICLDPPKFVSQKSHLRKGLNKYQAINQLAFSLLKPEGLLFTFSCSGAVDLDSFIRMVSNAAIEAKREVQIVSHFWQSSDHPYLPSCPQSAYLKGLLLRAN